MKTLEEEEAFNRVRYYYEYKDKVKNSKSIPGGVDSNLEKISYDNKNLASYIKLENFAKKNNWIEKERYYKGKVFEYKTNIKDLQDKVDSSIDSKEDYYTSTDGGDKKLGLSSEEESIIINNLSLHLGKYDDY